MGGVTVHKQYSKVYHSVYAIAWQEGETSERAKCRAKLAAKEHVAFKLMRTVFRHGLAQVVCAYHDCIGQLITHFNVHCSYHDCICQLIAHACVASYNKVYNLSLA